MLAKLWKWRMQKSWHLFLLISSEQSVSGHMLLSNAVSPPIKLGTSTTCLRCTDTAGSQVKATATGPSGDRPHTVMSMVSVTMSWDCSLIYSPPQGPPQGPEGPCSFTSHLSTMRFRASVADGTLGLDLRDPLMRVLPRGGLGFKTAVVQASPDIAGSRSPLTALGWCF